MTTKISDKVVIEYQNAENWYKYLATEQEREKVRQLYLKGYLDLDVYSAFAAAVGAVRKHN